MKLIIDTDPGTDDAIAIMMAMGSPDIDLLGLTTVGGNGRLADSTRNALRLLDYLGQPEAGAILLQAGQRRGGRLRHRAKGSDLRQLRRGQGQRGGGRPSEGGERGHGGPAEGIAIPPR